MGDLMTMTLSDDDYRRLLVLTFLGEWMVNAIRKEPDPSYGDAASRVYSFAKGTPLEMFTVFDGKIGEWAPSEKLESEAHPLIDEYDDKTFWEELTARLTERDLISRHGERAVRSMRPDQRSRAAKVIAQAYAHEFEDRGLNRFFVDESPDRGS